MANRTTAPTKLTKSDHQDRVMMHLIRSWLYKHDAKAAMCPTEPLIKKLVSVVRHLLEEFCYACPADDMLPIVFLHADRFVSNVGFVTKDHLAGILISSLTVVVKFYEDRGLYNCIVAEACGMTLQQVNKMERTFLTHLNFELMVSPSQISSFYLSCKRAWEERNYTINSSYSPSPSFAADAPSVPTFSSSPSSTKSNPLVRAKAVRSSLASTINHPRSSTISTPTFSSTTSTVSSISTKKSISSKTPTTPATKPNKLARFTLSWKVLSLFKHPTLRH